MNNRIVGIDAWRGMVLAIMGVAVHAASHFPDRAWAISVQLLSYTFRMEAFFAIAGFLAFLTQARPKWIKRRTVQLMVPFIVVAITFLPAVHASDLRHLWFLPVLMACAFLPKRPLPIAPLIIAVPIMKLLAVAIADQYPLPYGILNLFTAFLYFSLFYLIGQWIARTRPSFDRRYAYAAVAVLITWMVVSIIFPDIFHGQGRPILLKVTISTAQPIIALIVTFGIFSHALTVRAIHWPMPQLSKSAYTIYLLHYPAIEALFALLRTVIGSDIYLFLTIIVCAMSLTLAIHFWIVERFAVMALLLNGRVSKSSMPALARSLT